jgi:hypothetical protein
MNDIEILQHSYSKYKDKSGRKAQLLKFWIENIKALYKLQQKYLIQAK